MATRILGLDIQKEYLSAVVVEQRGTERIIRACASMEVNGVEQVSVLLSDFLQQIGLDAGSCVLGLPLSIVSLRNLSLPFIDRRKINQVLPLELEEQLLAPVDDQIIDFKIIGRETAASHLLVGAVEKETLRSLLHTLEENGQSLQAVTPSTSALAREYMQDMENSYPVLFLHADTHAINIAVWAGGRVVFMRRIAYPEQFFSEDTLGNQQGLDVFDHEAAKKSIALACENIKTSLNYFQLEIEEDLQVRSAVLSGCIAGEDPWCTLITSELGLKTVVSPPLHERKDVRLPADLQDGWQPSLFDTGLALALEGLQKKKKDQSLNFLQGEFAGDTLLFLSRRSLLAAAVVVLALCVGGLGFLWADYRALSSRSSVLHGEMKAIFKQTFPGVTRIVDPYVQMQSKLREMQGSEVSIPLFSGEKRVLEILADISARIPKDISLHVSRLVVDQEAVRIKGTTDAYNNVDVIKNKLAASQRYADVKIVSATADKKKGSIRFEIRLQLVEAS